MFNIIMKWWFSSRKVMPYSDRTNSCEHRFIKNNSSAVFRDGVWKPGYECSQCGKAEYRTRKEWSQYANDVLSYEERAFMVSSKNRMIYIGDGYTVKLIPPPQPSTDAAASQARCD